ncbi:MAG: hypothetical protein JRD89_17355 [Deltaproteobacteria bacterium]|nr:hypothetical protein [Deltaproteobacteria bacterium]
MESLQERAAQEATRLGMVYERLTGKELEKFNRAFERSLVLAYPEREIRDAFLRHQGEILLGAMVAKEQMDAEIDGEQPSPGKIGGPVPIRACFVGVGDDWEDLGSFTTGSPQNWIHSGTTLLGGTTGNPIRIGDNAVLVVIGIRSRHPSPKIESVKFTIDGNEKPVIITAFAQKATAVPAPGLAFKELDYGMIWRKDTEVLGKIFASAAYGSTCTDYPELVGAAFIMEPQLRVHDAYDLCGTAANRDVHKVVRTT